MNNALKGIIIFLSGAAVGGVGTWLAVKTYYEHKANTEIDEMSAMYQNRLEEFTTVVTGNSLENSEIKPEEESTGLEGNVSSLDEGKHQEEPKINYSKYFKKGEAKLKELDIINRGKEAVIEGMDNDLKDDLIEDDPSELEGPEDDEEYGDEEDELEQEDYEMYLVNEEHKKAVAEGRAPYAIDASDFGHIPGYDTMNLYYYPEDNVLVDEEKEEVDNPALFVGDLLECDWVNNDAIESICVRSDVTMTDVEIHKVEGRFYNE